jgi:hypothetical protein
MRRTMCLLVALVLLMFGGTMPAAQPAPSPQGALQAAFHSAFSGGNGNAYAFEAHNAMSLSHSANNSIFDPGDFTVEAGARRIIPGLFDQEYCASNVFGIWWFLLGPEKQDLKDTEVHIWFDGEELTLMQTAVKRIVDPQDFFGFDGDEWWGSVGVPVLGALEPGEYPVESTALFPGNALEEFSALITILDC